jgi:hypothetical protein
MIISSPKRNRLFLIGFILLIIGVCSLYFFIDSNQKYGLTTDLWTHDVNAHTIQSQGTITSSKPGYLGLEWQDAFGFNLWQATLSNITGIDVSLICLYSNVLLGASLILVCFLFFSLVVKGRNTILLILFILFLTGGIGYLYNLKTNPFDHINESISNQNNNEYSKIRSVNFNQISKNTSDFQRVNFSYKLIHSVTQIIGLILFLMFIYFLTKKDFFSSGLFLITIFLTHRTTSIFTSIFFFFFIFKESKVNLKALLLPTIGFFFWFSSFLYWMNSENILKVRLLSLFLWGLIFILILVKVYIKSPELVMVFKYGAWFVLGGLFCLLVFSPLFLTSNSLFFPFHQKLFWLMGPLILGLLNLKLMDEVPVFWALISGTFFTTFLIFLDLGLSSDRLFIFLELALVPCFVLLFRNKITSKRFNKKILLILFLLLVFIISISFSLYVEQYVTNHMSNRVDRFMPVSNFINEQISNNKTIGISSRVHTKWGYGRCIPFLTQNKILNNKGYDLDYIKGKTNSSLNTTELKKILVNMEKNNSLLHMYPTLVLSYPEVVKEFAPLINGDYLLAYSFEVQKLNDIFPILFEGENYAVIKLR